ncbi:calcium-binding protein [Thetidibacter halocola]|uniref:Calcium-binding protein n=1 Tax=Thetidibacter halocola TaxID=2827239 RepID=A0A8J8B8G4_9RHOB|nr:calcium-binding protein [Thetidibacter halocola]MBS0123138.1 hypothetical protein [Thetidibacter halocola]
MPRIHFEPGIQPAVSVIPVYFQRLLDRATLEGASGPPDTWRFSDGALDYHVRIETLITEEVGGRTVIAGGTITALRANIVVPDYDVTISDLSLDVAELRAAQATDTATPSGAVIRLLLEQDWTWIDNYSSTTLDGTSTEPASGQRIALLGHDRVFLREGNDRFWLATGDDFAAGQRGDDSLAGEEGADTLFGNRGRDTLEGGAGDDRLFGGRAADSLVGGTGNDLLLGGGGADWLEGGAGDDTLRGGADADDFVFRAVGSDGDADVIRDFLPGTDRLHLFGTAGASLKAQGADTLVTWEGGTILLEGVADALLGRDILILA